MSAASSTTDEILSCAQSLIVTGGYHGFSYADIASVVGIRKPSIHHHFPTKVDLVRTLVHRYREQAQAGIADMERHFSDPLELLRAYADYWRTCIADATQPFCVCAVLAGELPALPDEVASEVTAHFRALSGWVGSVFKRAAAQGRLHLANAADVEAEAFIATVHGAMLSARAYRDPQMFAVIIDSLLDRFAVRGTT